MKTAIVCLALAAAGLAGCNVTEAGRASTAAHYGDKPAAITCYAYGVLTFDGRSTGKVIYDEGGRLTFVDAASGRLTTIEGECRVVYAR